MDSGIDTNPDAETAASPNSELDSWDGPLSNDDAIDILSSNQNRLVKVGNTPPVKPIGGTLYIYKNDDPVKRDDWKADQHRWVNKGPNNFPKKDPLITRTRFYIKQGAGDRTGSGSFVRTAYTLYENSNQVLIHYMGSESLSSGFPHGNSKNSRSKFNRTAPSALHSIREAVTSSESNPHTIYQRLVSDHNIQPDHNGVLNPRNTKQVRNSKAHVVAGTRSKDPIRDLLQMAHQLKHLPEVCYLDNDLYVILHYPEWSNEVNDLLEIDQDSRRFVLGYDTTFNVGDFYVSSLVIRNILFEGSPVFPLAFLIHERKYQKPHTRLFEAVREKIPNLAKFQSRIPIVFDREDAFSNAVSTIFPSMPIFFCWNHLKRDLHRYLQTELKANVDEIAIYKQDLISLLKANSEDDFEKRYEDLTSNWTQSVKSYFDRNMKSDIKRGAGAWLLRPHKVYDSLSGITNNQSESFNVVLKQLQGWKEAPIDAIVLSLYFLCKFYFYEYKRGRLGVGNFVLREVYESARLQDGECIMPPGVTHWRDIVEETRNGRLNMDDSDGDDGQIPASQPDSQTESEPTRYSGQIALANEVIRSNRISFVPEQHLFCVVGSRGDNYCIKLFPKETCGCASNATCYHILAARLLVGMGVDNPETRPVNLTVLRKRGRSREDKKSGNKKPRKNDYDRLSTPAPDSLVSSNVSTPASDSLASSIVSSSPTTPEQSQSPRPISVTASNVSSPVRTSPEVVAITTPTPPKSCLKKTRHGNQKITFNVTRTHPITTIRAANSKMSTPLTTTPPLPASQGNTSQLPDFTQILSSSPTNVSFTPERSQSPKTNPAVFTDIQLSPSPTVSPVLSPDQPIILPTISTAKRRRLFSPAPSPPKMSSQQSSPVRTQHTVHKLTPSKVMTISTGQWLCDSIIRDSQTILADQFPWFLGFQDTLFAPNVDMSLGMYNPGGFSHFTGFGPSQPVAQIHHTGHSHWIASTYIPSHDNESVYLFDSLLNELDPLTTSSMIQLWSIYGRGSQLGKLSVRIPHTQRQANSDDCGVFAVANIVEFCLDPCFGRTGYCRFRAQEMRKHLLKCLHDKRFTAFPRNNLSVRTKARHTEVEIEKNCESPGCAMPDCYDNMIQCSCCKKWYHMHCQNIVDRAMKGTWECSPCHKQT